MKKQFIPGQKINKGKLITGIILRILMICWAILIIFPIFWMLYSSFKAPIEFMSNKWSLPSKISFKNYIEAWNGSNFPTYFANSLFVTIVTTVLHLIMVSTTSYVLAKYTFFGKKILNNFYFFGMMIPSILMLVPLYTQITRISSSLANNRITLCVIYAVQSLPANIFLLTRFMANINDALLESASLDGANEFRKFKDIVIPSVKPTLIFILITTAMGTFNEYTVALTFLEENRYTIPIGINSLQTNVIVSNEYGILFASVIILTIPILILYTVFNKKIQSGIDMSEGVKG